jgi:hypothetical protein
VTKSEIAKRRTGRPRKYPPQKRFTQTFRVQRSVHEKLQAAAAASGRSHSEEIERRLEQSFEFNDLIESVALKMADQTQQLLAEAVGGPQNFSIALALGRVFAHVEDVRGQSWRESEEVQTEIAAQIIRLLPGLFRNPPPPFGQPFSPASPAATLQALRETIYPSDLDTPTEEGER